MTNGGDLGPRRHFMDRKFVGDCRFSCTTGVSLAPGVRFLIMCGDLRIQHSDMTYSHPTSKFGSPIRRVSAWTRTSKVTNSIGSPSWVGLRYQTLRKHWSTQY